MNDAKRRVVDFGAGDGVALGVFAARDEHLAVAHHGRGVQFAPGHHRAREREQAARRIVEFGAGEQDREAALVDLLAAGHQHFAVGQERRGMGVAARAEPAGLAELTFLRIVELAVDEPSHAAAAVAAGDQHFAVGQQGRGMVLAGGIDLAGKTEGAGAGARTDAAATAQLPQPPPSPFFRSSCMSFRSRSRLRS